MNLSASLPTLAAALLLVSPLAADAQTKAAAANPTADFERRAQNYAMLQRKLASTLPPLAEKSDAKSIASHSEKLGKAVQQARHPAKQGELFTEDISGLIRKSLQSTTRGRRGAEARREILETSAKRSNGDEPAAPVDLKVNTPYPRAVSLSTVPPDVLAKLPALPKELEYRFVGPHLILFSPASNLIIDYLPSALAAAPNPPKTSNSKK